MRTLSRLPSCVSPEFRNRVRHECEQAAIFGQPIGYQELAEAVIGDADRGSRDRRFIRLVDKALCEMIHEDVQAGRPLAAVAVQPVGGEMPAIGFFECAWKAGRFASGDAEEFSASEWAALRDSLGVACEQEPVQEQAEVLPLAEGRVAKAEVVEAQAESVPPAVIAFTKVKLPFGWLGNMSPHAIRYEGKAWRTAEALFQALRFDDEQVREEIRSKASPMAAKFAAKKHRQLMVVQPRSEQDLEIMRFVLRLKVSQHAELRQRLLATGEARIVEDASRRSSRSGLFWGAARRDGEWAGENQLGVLWMELRDELRAESPQVRGQLMSA